jgi:hypothetical protein
MASIFDDKTDVVLAGKVHRRDDIFARGNIDGIANKIAQQTWPIRCGKGITALVGEIRLHHRR